MRGFGKYDISEAIFCRDGISVHTGGVLRLVLRYPTGPVCTTTTRWMLHCVG